MTALIELYNTDHLSLVNWVCREYGIGTNVSIGSNEHKMRRETIATRLRLYRDQIEVPLSQVIGQIYDTVEMQQTLKKYIPICKGQNVERRIVNEVASLYDRPALRTLLDRNEEFHAEEKRLNLNFVHQEAHRLTNLCNEVLIWAFIGAADPKISLRIVTPDAFDAIPDPRDKLVAAGYLLDFPPVSIMPDASQLPHYELWDDTYRYRINKAGRLVDAHGKIAIEPEAHGLPRIPGVLFHRREPTTCILDASYGEDIKSAHLAVALLDVMIMRLSKVQGENQPILSGNLANVATGQVMNGERPLALPPDVVASVLNMKTSPEHYLAVQRNTITGVAQTYGMSYAQFTMNEGSDAASGKAYAMRREKLTELRMEQRGRAVKHEAEVITLIGFDPEGASIDYQEQAVPQDAAEKVSLLKDKMQLGLDSVVAFMMREDPDLTREQALERIHENVRDYAGIVAWVRAINAPAGATVDNPGQSPQENGAMGGRTAPPDPNEVPTKDLPAEPSAQANAA